MGLIISFTWKKLFQRLCQEWFQRAVQVTVFNGFRTCRLLMIVFLLLQLTAVNILKQIALASTQPAVWLGLGFHSLLLHPIIQQGKEGCFFNSLLKVVCQCYDGFVWVDWWKLKKWKSYIHVCGSWTVTLVWTAGDKRRIQRLFRWCDSGSWY